MTQESPWRARTEPGEPGMADLAVATTPFGNKMKVAIVGTGMAGLATGYLLQHDELQRYSVTLFEKVRGRITSPSTDPGTNENGKGRSHIIGCRVGDLDG